MVGYCGDGVNDLPALDAADLGVGLGSGEGVMAAPVVSPKMSIAGDVFSCVLESFEPSLGSKARAMTKTRPQKYLLWYWM